MLTLNADTLNKVVATALTSAASQPRWINAIERAATELASNPYIEIQGDHLLIGSPSGNSYESNGVCQCQAYLLGNKPCWHRAAHRLLIRYQQEESK